MEPPRSSASPAADGLLERIAVGLVTAYRDRTLVDAPSAVLPGLTKAQALAIAARGVDLRTAAGETPIGYKVGFTNGAVRAQFGAEAQLAAPIYDRTLMPTPRIDAGALLGPRIEPEIVVGIGPDGRLAWAALGFEIVQSHVADWNFGYLDAIADFGLHAALFIGQRRAFTSLDGQALLSMHVQLRRNDDVVERGASADVDGGAPGSVAWLRDELLGNGRDLRSGDIVSTGSMTRVPAIAPGQRWTIEALGAELPALTISVD